MYVVVGGTGDLGSAIVSRLARRGKVWATYFRSTPTTAAPGIFYSHLDATREHDVREYFQSLLVDGPLQGVVLATGSVLNRPLSLTSLADWESAFSSNVAPAFLVAKFAAERLAVDGGGNIVILGSVGGRRTNVGQAAYAASKSALPGLARVVAKEFGRFGVTCNIVASGPVESKMVDDLAGGKRNEMLKAIPLRRFAKPDDIASVVEFLVSNRNSYVTGQTITVDGGIDT